MSTAITEDHIALADTASDFLAKRGSLAAARELLEGADETLPEFWDDLRALGWLGLHVPEAHGGSGYGLPELSVVVEEMGRALAPGAFVVHRDRQRRAGGRRARRRGRPPAAGAGLG